LYAILQRNFIKFGIVWCVGQSSMILFVYMSDHCYTKKNAKTFFFYLLKI